MCEAISFFLKKTLLGVFFDEKNGAIKSARTFKNLFITIVRPYGAKVVSSHVGAVADVCGFVHVLARDIIAPASSSGSDKRGRTQPSFSVLHSVL